MLILNEGTLTKDQERFAELQKLLNEHKAQLDNLIDKENRDANRRSAITSKTVTEETHVAEN